MRYSLLFIVLLLPLSLFAQKERRTACMVGIGPTEIYDTYLSQEHFDGVGLTVLATVQTLPTGKHWTTLVEHQAHLSTTDDRSGDSHEIFGDYSLFLGRMRSFNILPSLSVEVGAMAVGNVGFIYNTSNGNNPAQARVSLNLMPAVTASWDFCLLKRKCALHYEAQLPLVGVMFSPNYGQSYYEIFSRGNYDHNIVPTTFVSAPSMRHQLMADVNIGPTATLRLGYLADLQQAKVNDLKSHVYSNHFMIGFVKRFTITHHRP